MEKIKLKIKNQQQSLQGALSFSQLQPWPKSFFSPTIMGVFGFLPLMQCYHGLLSFDHNVTGQLDFNNINRDYNKGRGYIEKDWGQAFPEGYIWMQTNNFDVQQTSFMASIAVIPYLGRKFTGFLMAFWHRQKLYLFTTYNLAKIIKMFVDKNEVGWEAINRCKNLKLKVKGIRTGGGLLKAPTIDKMRATVRESLTATITVELIDLRKNDLIFKGTGTSAGLEVCGDIKKLTAGIGGAVRVDI